MSSFNTSSHIADSGPRVNGSSPTLTVPSGVVNGELMLAYAQVFTYSDAGTKVYTDITCTAASGHTWTKVGTFQSSGIDTGPQLYAACVVFKRVATSGDAGDTLTFSAVGTGPAENNNWWTGCMGSYNGFPGGVRIVVQEGDITHSASPVPFPAGTTDEAGDWWVGFGVGAPNGGGTVNSASGCTSREITNNSGTAACLFDSNGSVGGSGTAFGGSNQGANWTGGGSPAMWRTMFSLTISPTLSADTGTGAIAMKKMKIAIVGRLPGTGAIKMKKMKISATGTAPLRGTGTIKMKKMKIAGQGSQPDLLMVYQSTDGNGVDTYLATSPYNGPASHTVRILAPTSPGAGYSHAFLYALSVTQQGDTTFGEGLDTVRVGGWHNTYNMTVIEPQFGIDPWFADSDIDAKWRFETFMLRLSDWVKSHLGSTGVEKQVLIGFSKSGIGGQGLILNNPTVFDKCISWDFPTDGDMTIRFSGNADFNYGTSANFNARYDLGATNLARWKAPFQGPKPRLYIADGTSFNTDVSDYDARLTAQTMTHIYPAHVTRSHNWDSGWVGPALAAMMVQESYGSGGAKMKKMRLGGTAHAPLYGTSGIRMKKMRLSSAGKVTVSGTGGIRMKKMRIKTPTPQGGTGISSSLLVFTEV